MKFLISLLICFNAQAMILIEHNEKIGAAKYIAGILAHRYQIPKTLIELKNGSCVGNKTKKIAHLCIKKDGELIIKDINNNIIRESLSVFRN